MHKEIILKEIKTSISILINYLVYQFCGIINYVWYEKIKRVKKIKDYKSFICEFFDEKLQYDEVSEFIHYI